MQVFGLGTTLIPGSAYRYSVIGSKVVVCYTQPLSVALGHVIKLFEVQSNPDVQDCERLPCLSSSSIPIIINSKCLFLEWMIDWIGGQSTLIKLGGLALGIISLYIVKSFSNPHRSWNYFMAGFCCWFYINSFLAFTRVHSFQSPTLSE